MQPLELRRRRAACAKFRAQPDLDRFDVVIGARFDLLDGRHVGGGRVRRERAEQVAGRARQPGQSGRGGTRGERQEPRAFHAHALAHQAGFAEYVADRREFAGVPAVEG